jgi:hypothetical protein
MLKSSEYAHLKPWRTRLGNLMEPSLVRNASVITVMDS